MSEARLLIATTNAGKLREYRAAFETLPIRLLSLDDVGLGGMDVEETGDTFEENAMLKATAYGEASSLPVLRRNAMRHCWLAWHIYPGPCARRDLSR